MTLRALRRAASLGLALLLCSAYACSLYFGRRTAVRRARWMHRSARLVVRIFGITLHIQGEPPASGLVVANHLSYLDILVFAAAMPCCLVSKEEIARWPVFGMLARAGGTIFVDRGNRASAERVVRQMTERMRAEVPVLFFPEGTSTDGSHVLRFRPRLFTPAVEADLPVTAAAVRYTAENDVPERDLCWFGDAVFVSHLWQTLAGPDFTAEIQFALPQTYSDVRSAATHTHEVVEALRALPSHSGVRA